MKKARKSIRKITQKITKNRVKTDDLTTRSYFETHKDPISGLFGGEWVMGAGRISKKAIQVHLKAVKEKWPEEKWRKDAPHMPEAPYPLQSLTRAYVMPRRKCRSPK